MDFFNQNRGIRWLVIGLIILNLLLLASFWYSKLGTRNTTIEKKQQARNVPDQEQTGRMEQRQDQQLEAFLKRELDFDEDQIASFKKLRVEHRQNSRKLRFQMDELRREMMDQLLEDEPDYDIVEQKSLRMGQILTELEKSAFYHLNKLVSIGNEEQQKKARTMMRAILEQLRPPEHRSIHEGPMGPGMRGRPGQEGMNRPFPPPPRRGEQPRRPPPDRRNRDDSEGKPSRNQ